MTAMTAMTAVNESRPGPNGTLASRPPGTPGECLAADTVDAFTRGELSPSSVDQLEKHIAACSPCRELLSELVQLGFADEAPPVTTASTAPVSSGTRLELASGSHVGRYVILQRLGEGGMGVVYSAHDPELSRKVALKLLRGDFAHAQHGTLRERLRREAQAMAQMAHPNVVTIYDVGTWGDLVFIAMEFIDGETLSQWLARGPHSWRDVLAMFLPAGNGLAAAHAVGVVHRDFKPANVLVGLDRRVRVGDFGLAAINASSPQSIHDSHGSAALTADMRRTGSVAGTPYYMAPEQLLGRFTDARSDQFSFCVALYQAIAGHHPFDRRHLADGLAAASHSRSSKTRVPPVTMPRWLHRVLVRGLSVDPADRFSSMEALLGALVRKPRRRWPAVACALAATALLVAGVLQLREMAYTTDDASHRAVTHVDGRPPGHAKLFAGAPELLHAYERDFAAMHTGECESPQVRCAVQATNLLRNAGFDRPGHAWQPGAGPSGARLDWQSASLRVTTFAPNGVIAQEVPWIAAPGQSQSLRVWVRAPRGSPPARGRLVLWGIGRAGAASATTRFLAGPEWSEVSVTLVSNSHTDHFRAELYLDSPGSVEVDSAELVDAGLMDPSFELYPSTAWLPFNSSANVEVRSAASAIGASDALDGARWLELRTSKPDGSIAQDTRRIPLVGTTYTFVAWMRAGPEALSARGNLALWALGERQKLAHTGFEVIDDLWQRVEVSIDIEEHGHTGLRAELYLASIDTWLRMDAAMLVPAGLVDASFERGSSAWYSPQQGGAQAERIADASPRAPNGLFVSGRSVDHAKNGAFWLRLKGQGKGGSIAQDLAPPLKGSSYTFSAWVRAAPGSTQSASGSLLIDATGSRPAQGRTEFQVSAEWTLVTATLEVERDDHTGLRVVIESTDSSTQLDVDGTRLTGASFIPPGGR
jgi:predicted Ser/Thr protein kinase